MPTFCLIREAGAGSHKAWPLCCVPRAARPGPRGRCAAPTPGLGLAGEGLLPPGGVSSLCGRPSEALSDQKGLQVARWLCWAGPPSRSLRGAEGRLGWSGRLRPAHGLLVRARSGPHHDGAFQTQ